MSIHIITEYKYPDIGGSGIRIASWVKGLEEEKVQQKVNVIVVAYHNHKIPKAITLPISILYKIVAIFPLLLRLKKGDLAYFYGSFELFWIPFILKLKGIEIAFENNEFPRYLAHKKSLYFLFRYLFSIFSMKSGKYLVTCSKALKEFYTSKTGIEKVFIMPLILDSSIFKYPKVERANVITYCGFMGHNKDGVLDLIEAFSIVHKKYPKWKLKLVGNADKSTFKEMDDLITSLSLKEAITLTGKVPHIEVIKYLNESSVLVLARPNNKQAQGGFPSKVGEYLSTGRPIVVTRVGEIADYIIDNVNGFLVEPDAPERFAERLMFVIENYTTAQKVGEKGRELSKSFESKNQVKKLIRFLEYA
ncbi:glycosyltransferase family 4 protein [Flagellimonas lutimaris]|uniref:glycosyltransferase family 4 protein n=1 Tax=Flagellimonas lutimaris TaxID=475082 RepID=UPI003F5CD3E1